MTRLVAVCLAVLVFASVVGSGVGLAHLPPESADGPRTLASGAVAATDANGSTDGGTTTRTQEGDATLFNGIHRPQLDGLLYGHAGTAVPRGFATEWADGFDRGVKVVASNRRSYAGQLFVKAFAGELFLGLSFSRDETDPPQSVAVLIDRDGSGDVSAGDARLAFATRSGSRVVAEAPTLFVHRNGEFVRPDLRVGEVGTLVVRRGDGSVTVEASVDTAMLDELLGSAGSGGDGPERTGVDVVVRTETVTYDLEGVSRTYATTGAVLDPELWIPQITLPEIDLGVDALEVTQAVQTPTNDLRLVRDKETLARAFVTHDRASAVSVTVTFKARDVSGSVPVYLGSRSVTFPAPPGTPDRTDLDDSANLELPAAWTDVGRLDLRASVAAPGFVDVGSSPNVAGVRKRLYETHDLAIYRIRVNTGTISSPQQASVAELDRISAGLADSFPVADPQFRTLGWETIGVQSVSDRSGMIAALDSAGDQVRAAWLLAFLLAGGNPGAPLPDQMYGVTPVTVRGLSDPRWDSASGDSLAAFGSGFDLIMAHEVNHNIGNGTWGRHVTDTGGGYGCNAPGPDARWNALFDDDGIHALGWRPGSGLMPATNPDFMGYCTNGWWISDYRWELLLDRLRTFRASQPIHPDLLGLETSGLAPSGKTVLGTELPTVRVIGGTLLPDGGGRLDPSFEQPGVLGEDRTRREAEAPTARLRIVRSDESVELIPLTARFEGVEGERLDSDGFSVLVRDNGTIERIELLDAATGDVLAARSGTDWTLERASFELPERFARGRLVDVGVDVTSDAGVRLHKRLLYSPDPESGVWFPYGQSFAGSEYGATFTTLPGGEEARFLLLVSDGVRTGFATSPAFSVPPLPPTVTIDRNDRWMAEGQAGTFDDPVRGEVRNVAGPVNASVGSTVSLDAAARSSAGGSLGLPGTSGGEGTLRWTARDANGNAVAADSGTRFDHAFAAPGTYSVAVIATDPATELTASDAVTVRVGLPPLPEEATVTAFRTALDRATSIGEPWLELVPADATATAGTTTVYELVFDPANTGVGSYDLNVTVSDPSVARIAGATDAIGGRIAGIDVASGGDEVRFRVAGGDTADTGPVTIARIVLAARHPGTVRLAIPAGPIVGDENDAAYSIAGTAGATLRVLSKPPAPDLAGDGRPALDLDGDGLHEDITGDENFNVIDVSVFLEAFDRPAVQDSVELFDFNGDRRVNVVDVAALLDVV